MSVNREPVLPGPDHPITIVPFAGRVRARIGERTIADTNGALELREAAYPAVMYVPLADVDQAALLPSDTASYCPYKGQAGYYGISDGQLESITDAVWYYATPYPAVAAIVGHVAFYPDKVELTVEPAADRAEPRPGLEHGGGARGAGEGGRR